MTSRTSLIISGSSALVGSSMRMSFGSMASERAIATRCCWPPESWPGIFFAWLATPTRSSSAIAFSSASFFFILRTLIGPSVTFSRTVLCANRLNDWKTMPTSARSFASPAPSSGSFAPSMVIVPESIVSSRLIARQSVDLPDPGRADHDDDLAAVDDGVDVLQDVQVAEVLVDVIDDHERLAAPNVDVRGLGRRCR